MEPKELRSIQELLKEQYRKDPAATRVTLRARVAAAGLHPATGGDGTQLCSGYMLLEAPAACAGVTLRAVATSLGVEVPSGTVEVEGDLDFRGSLSVDRDAPVCFTSIRVQFVLDSDASDDDLDTFLRLTERYCVVGQTLTASPTLAFSR
jgi:uncharacterized OsmC-like protein